MQPAVVKPTTGWIDTVQAVAVELSNPDPVNDTGVLTTPFVGERTMNGTTVNSAVEGVSAPGLPVTVTVHGLLSAVADEPTMNVPVPVPPLMLQVGEAIKVAPLGLGLGSVVLTLHDVSVTSRPLATNEIVSPGEPEDGVSISEGPTVTENVPTAVSPNLPVTITV